MTEDLLTIAGRTFRSRLIVGTGKYAPFRFLCPPEASVIELVPRQG